MKAVGVSGIRPHPISTNWNGNNKLITTWITNLCLDSWSFVLCSCSNQDPKGKEKKEKIGVILVGLVCNFLSGCVGTGKNNGLFCLKVVICHKGELGVKTKDRQWNSNAPDLPQIKANAYTYQTDSWGGFRSREVDAKVVLLFKHCSDTGKRGAQFKPSSKCQGK